MTDIEIRISEEALVEAGATPELARGIANLGTIALRDSLALARLEGKYEAAIENLRERVAELENGERWREAQSLPCE